MACPNWGKVEELRQKKTQVTCGRDNDKVDTRRQNRSRKVIRGKRNRRRRLTVLSARIDEEQIELVARPELA